MAESPLIDRLRSRAESITDTRILQIVLAFIAGGLFVSLVAAALAAAGEVAERWEWLAPVDAVFRWLDGFFQNFSTEMIGAAITFILLEILLAGRREKEAVQREKERLVLQMGSRFNETAIEAVRQLRVRGWLTDGSLQEADLIGANLKEVDLSDTELQWVSLDSANLQGSDLMFANLQEASLGKANLQGAYLGGTSLQDAGLWEANLQEAGLWNANLKGADLGGANLQEADLLGVNLQGANLGSANLQGANLFGVNLQGANLADVDLQGARIQLRALRQAKSLLRTTLPDGTELPQDRSWHSAFEEWCKTVELDRKGCIVPAPLDKQDDE